MINNELITKAKELGFESYFNFDLIYTEIYHLWLADLQK